MRTNLDLSPLFRSGIGFDRMFSPLENAGGFGVIDSWPPYDILRTGEDDYRIIMVVAGFSRDEMPLTQEQSTLAVSGQRANEEEGQYLHRGISGRTFQRRFHLADHVKAVGASLVNGLPPIDLRHEIPEAMKPRRIAIASDTALPQLETHHDLIVGGNLPETARPRHI